ncbi:hypothetical protein SCP_0213990 [Sparassis crispa]|uniref:Uncharacterized protein n=1 Tax=Sparassis crispa TaxID=139825 RepID=A0A401GDD2_9APHY|nr:hypothetical protein SCP_0213990 [Sparassis crispa]GBE80189.1 hypothetical protein SCP_0213990 [Sparassis crispa]
MLPAADTTEEAQDIEPAVDSIPKSQATPFPLPCALISISPECSEQQRSDAIYRNIRLLERALEEQKIRIATSQTRCFYLQCKLRVLQRKLDAQSLKHKEKVCRSELCFMVRRARKAGGKRRRRDPS